MLFLTFLIAIALCFTSINAYFSSHLLSVCRRRFTVFSQDDDSSIPTSQQVLPPAIDISSSGKAKNTQERVREIWRKTKSGQELYRRYPFDKLGLQVLYDVNNYYSGTFKEIFWHQNADQLLIFIPLGDDGKDLVRRDVSTTFDHEFVQVKVKDQIVLSFKPMQKISPDGCFWSFETSSNGERYLQIDLEKRYRFTNWKGLFADLPEKELESLDLRSQVLDKLYKLNQAVQDGSSSSKTVEEMLQDPQLMEVVLNELEEERNKAATKKQRLEAKLSSSGIGSMQENALTPSEQSLIDSIERSLDEENNPNSVIDVEQT